MAFRSKFEATAAARLRQSGVDFSYEKDVIEFVAPRKYTPDFRVGDIFIELKGYFKPSDRNKHLMIQAQHPELDIRFVFQNAFQKLSSSSKTTYAQWAEKHGFKWSNSVIPFEWLKKSSS